MDNSFEKIQQCLIKKYKDRKEQLTAELEEINSELKEIDGKLLAINTTFELIHQEGLSQRERPITSSDTSNKYANMKKKEAMLDVLNSNPEKEWRCNEVVKLLEANGFSTTSKDLLRDVYSELNRLGKEGKVEIIKKRSKRSGRKGTRYQIKRENISPIAEGIKQ